MQVNAAEEEERKNSSTEERRCLEDTPAAFEPEFALCELTQNQSRNHREKWCS